jgi:hypothetical protein
MMLRVFYRWVLRAHPPYFRQRFGDEMQSIFDCAQSPGEEIGLFVDAVLSLLRQWSLRPQFWEQPNLIAVTDGTPLFHSLDSFKPRATALVYGALLSAFVLNGICWTMGYAWNHPIFIEIRQPIISPPASWVNRTTPHPVAPVQVEPWLYTNQGRVVLIFNAPERGGSPCGDHAKASASGEVAPGAESGPCPATPSTATPPNKSGMVF